MQNIFSVPITILQLNNINNDILIDYAKSNYNENIKYINCKDTDFELQELNSVVLQQSKKATVKRIPDRAEKYGQQSCSDGKPKS